MVYRVAVRALACAVALAWAGAASAQTWTPEQQELWKFEELQWQMSKDKDSSWIEKMVHPNLTYWVTGAPVPQNRASLSHWNRYTNASSTVLEQELFPISITITGNIAVVQYRYQTAREDYKKERETVWGRYTDVLVKEGGRWLFIAWTGGDDPKK
jgi:ketosteroid isomerase-like protein